MAKFKIEDLKQEAQMFGWKLVSNEYKNLDTPLEYVCDKGHTVIAPYKKIRNKYKCPTCKEFHSFTEKDIQTNVIEKQKESFRILAFDQSSTISGYSVFDNDKLIHYGFKKVTGKVALHRYVKIKKWVDEQINQWEPDLVSLEDVQLQSEEKENVRSVLTYSVLTKLLGILECFLYEKGIKTETVHVSTWRHSEQIKGKNRAERKKSAQDRVKKCYGIDVSDDVAEAILIGRYTVEHFSDYNIVHW